jgi:hypothetical protein
LEHECDETDDPVDYVTELARECRSLEAIELVEGAEGPSESATVFRIDRDGSNELLILAANGSPIAMHPRDSESVDSSNESESDG